MIRGTVDRPPHREKTPVRRCGCGTWLASANPTSRCAPCSGGDWGEVPEDIFATLGALAETSRVRTKDLVGDALQELMES